MHQCNVAFGWIKSFYLTALWSWEACGNPCVTAQGSNELHVDLRILEEWTFLDAEKRSSLGGHNIVWIVVVLVLFFLTRILFLCSLPVFYDESIYIRWAQRALHEGAWFVSLTDGKPPLHVWWMVPFLRFFTDPLMAGRLASVLAGLVSLAGVVLIGRELKDLKTGLFAGILYVVCPFTLWYDRLAITEGLLLALFVFTIFFELKASRNLSPVYFLLAGICFGLALLAKGTAQLLALIVPFAFVVRPKNERPTGFALKWASGVVMSLLVGFGLYNVLRISPLFGQITAKTSQTTKTFSELLQEPFDVFFVNFTAIIKTLWVFLTPSIFILSIAGLILGLKRRWRPAIFLSLWVTVVWIVESLIAKHWMFPTILPRFFLALVPPLLISTGYCLLESFEYLKEKYLEASKKTLQAFVAAFLIVLLGFPLLNVFVIAASPSNAVLPEWIRFQYLEGWPAGTGMNEIISVLEKESEKGRITVGSNMPGIGLPTDALLMYFHENKNVEIITFRYDARNLPDKLMEASKKRRTYVVFNMFGERNVPNPGWPVRTVRKFQKGEGSAYSIFLLRVTSA